MIEIGPGDTDRPRDRPRIEIGPGDSNRPRDRPRREILSVQR